MNRKNVSSSDFRVVLRHGAACLAVLNSYNVGSTISEVTQAHKALGVNITLCFHQHIRSVVNKAAAVFSDSLQSALCHSAGLIFSPYLSPPHGVVVTLQISIV